MYSYATYWQIADYLSIPRSNAGDLTGTDASNQIAIMNIARRLSRRFEKDTQAWFIPRVDTYYFDALYNNHIDSREGTLTFPPPLLSLTGVTLGDGTVLTVGTDVRARPRGHTPSRTLQLLGSTYSWSQYSDDWREAIAVTGIWGARKYYATEGWVSTNDTIKNAGGIDDSETEITVAGLVTDVDANGMAPRFDIGQVLRIESEYLIVIAVNYTDKKITVMRGQLGTTAASHDLDTPIDRFDVQPEIVLALAMTISNHNALVSHSGALVLGGDISANTVLDYPPTAAGILEQWRYYYIGIV